MCVCLCLIYILHVFEVGHSCLLPSFLLHYLALRTKYKIHKEINSPLNFLHGGYDFDLAAVLKLN